MDRVAAETGATPYRGQDPSPRKVLAVPHSEQVYRCEQLSGRLDGRSKSLGAFHPKHGSHARPEVQSRSKTVI